MKSSGDPGVLWNFATHPKSRGGNKEDYMQAQLLGTKINRRPKRRFVFTNVGSPDRIINLNAGQGWSVKGRRRQQTVLCLTGNIWVTQKGDLKDYLLEEGDAFLITRPGLVLVRALKPACIGYCEGHGEVSRRW
jgi:hypothetical protein